MNLDGYKLHGIKPRTTQMVIQLAAAMQQLQPTREQMEDLGRKAFGSFSMSVDLTQNGIQWNTLDDVHSPVTILYRNTGSDVQTMVYAKDSMFNRFRDSEVDKIVQRLLTAMGYAV